MRGKVWSLAIGNELNITHGERLARPWAQGTRPRACGFSCRGFSCPAFPGWEKGSHQHKDVGLLRGQVTVLQRASVPGSSEKTPAFFLPPEETHSSYGADIVIMAPMGGVTSGSVLEAWGKQALMGREGGGEVGALSVEVYHARGAVVFCSIFSQGACT